MKTTQEKLQIVTQQIRKDIPRLMELSMGCILKNYGTGKIYFLIAKNGEICFLQDTSDFKLSPLELTESTAVNYFEVIGHNILLSNILEWLEISKGCDMGKVCDYYISDEGVLTRKNQDNSYDFISEIDLSKPYLKNQSEELINFLYELINFEK